MELRDADQNMVDPNPTAETLIIGPDSKDLHLNTRTDVDCVHCYDDAFFGLPIDQVRCVLILMVFLTSFYGQIVAQEAYFCTYFKTIFLLLLLPLYIYLIC